MLLGRKERKIMDIITILRIIQLGLLFGMLILAINMLKIVNKNQKELEELIGKQKSLIKEWYK
jgi:hypothetical protein